MAKVTIFRHVAKGHQGFYIVKWHFWVPPWGNWLNKSFGDFSALTVNKT